MVYFGIVLFIVYLCFKFLYLYVPLKNKVYFDAAPEKDFKSFAVLVPAYNERDTILHCVKSLVKVDYPNFSVYLINDGSKDGTMGILDDFLHLRPVRLTEDGQLSFQPIRGKYRSALYKNVYVINKENGGKADALNAGLACCSEQIVITLDADCMLRYDSIRIMNRVFQNDSVAAAGGTVHITQSITEPGSVSVIRFRIKSIIKYQVMQYLTAFYLHKFTQSALNSLIVISGAYGAFRREILLLLNGYRASVGEDMDITLRIHSLIKAGHEDLFMTYVPESVCFTECPESIRSLTGQRIRWQKAFIDCFMNYGLQMFRRFKTGISCFFLLDSFLLGTLTSLLFLQIPLFFILTGRFSPVFIVFLSVDFVLCVLEAIVSIKKAARFGFSVSDNDKKQIVFYLLFQMYLFRFLNVFFAIIGTISYVFRRRFWNRAKRTGRSFANR